MMRVSGRGRCRLLELWLEALLKRRPQRERSSSPISALSDHDGVKRLEL